MNNEFKIKIVSDSSGQPVSLDSIPVEAADALKIFIESLTDFAKSYDDSSGIKLAIDNGCIETSIIFPETEDYITEDIESIISGKSQDNYRIKLFKDIQNKVLQNGLTYEVYLTQHDSQEEVTSYFKGKRFPIRRTRKDKNYELLFMEGFLFEAGGKSRTNVHVQVGNDEVKIECTRDQAKKINQRLYSSIYLAVTKISSKGKPDEYILIDSYLKEDNYLMLKSLHESLFAIKTIEKYDKLHYFIKDIINCDEEDNQELIKLIRLYNQTYIDRGILRTILMSLKPVLNNNSGLLPYYNRIAETLRIGSKSKMI